MLLNITTCDMLLKLLLLLSVKRNANVRKRFLTSSVIVFRKFMFHLSQLKSSSYVTIYFIFCYLCRNVQEIMNRGCPNTVRYLCTWVSFTANNISKMVFFVASLQCGAFLSYSDLLVVRERHKDGLLHPSVFFPLFWIHPSLPFPLHSQELHCISFFVCASVLKTSASAKQYCAVEQ